MKTILCWALLLVTACIHGQDTKITRIATITVDSLQLDVYRGLLKEQMEAAIKLEPGVLRYSVYTDKSNPFKVIILEVYASNSAYLLHRETAHFKKYKLATSNMVKKLELTELLPVMEVGK